MSNFVGLAISIEDSGIVCKEEGFHPHPTTCAKFYRCVRWSGELELVCYGEIWMDLGIVEKWICCECKEIA